MVSSNPVSPKHYKLNNGMEVIDIIEAVVPDPSSFYQGNIIKYISRFRNKGGIEDLKKAKKYTDFLIREITLSRIERELSDD